MFICDFQETYRNYTDDAAAGDLAKIQYLLGYNINNVRWIGVTSMLNTDFFLSVKAPKYLFMTLADRSHYKLFGN